MMRDAIYWLLWEIIVITSFIPIAPSHAKDGWEGRPLVCDMSPGPTLDKCQAWISTVQRPDWRGASCCGIADAYITDDFRTDENGELWAKFSFDYPLDPNTGAGGYKKGDEIKIPPEKRNHLAEDAGNTSGHGVTFIAGGAVICHFMPPLT